MKTHVKLDKRGIKSHDLYHVLIIISLDIRQIYLNKLKRTLKKETWCFHLSIYFTVV